MKTQFKCDIKDLTIVTEKWLSNGHWLVRRSAVKHDKRFKNSTNLVYGRYRNGEFMTKDTDDAAYENVIPKLENLKPLVKDEVNSSHITVNGDGSLKCTRVDFLIEGGESVGLDPKYACLLSLGNRAYGLDEKTPVVVTLADEIVAVVMPRRK